MPGQVLHKVPLFGWAIFVTAVLLLLALPVLAGIIIVILPALNSAILWEQLIITQSAGNKESLSLLRILRDNTPKFMCHILYFVNTLKFYSSFLLLNNNNTNSMYNLEPSKKNKFKLYFRFSWFNRGRWFNYCTKKWKI